jgi:ADP-ribose pyrophosphatase
MLEIVAGIVEEGESTAEVARREAQEEAGCSVTDVQHIMDFYPSAGGSTEVISLYYAALDLSGVKPGMFGLAEEHEDIRMQVLPFSQALHYLKTGKIKAALAIIALQWLALEKLNI